MKSAAEIIFHTAGIALALCLSSCCMPASFGLAWAMLANWYLKKEHVHDKIRLWVCILTAIAATVYFNYWYWHYSPLVGKHPPRESSTVNYSDS